MKGTESRVEDMEPPGAGQCDKRRLSGWRLVCQDESGTRKLWLWLPTAARENGVAALIPAILGA